MDSKKEKKREAEEKEIVRKQQLATACLLCLWLAENDGFS
jgi:hypothetical protein